MSSSSSQNMATSTCMTLRQARASTWTGSVGRPSLLRPPMKLLLASLESTGKGRYCGVSNQYVHCVVFVSVENLIWWRIAVRCLACVCLCRYTGHQEGVDYFFCCVVTVVLVLINNFLVQPRASLNMQHRSGASSFWVALVYSSCYRTSVCVCVFVC